MDKKNMASSLMTRLLILTVLAAAVTAQEFFFAGPEYETTYEGLSEYLVLTINRTGPAADNTTVVLEAYEATDNYRLQWSVPVEFRVGDSQRILPLGVLDDQFDEPDLMFIFRIRQPGPGYTIGSRNKVVVSYVDNDGPILFSCRFGDQCKNGGTCNQQTDFCNCNMYGFADCSVPIRNTSLSVCGNGAVDCGRAGVCVDDGLGRPGCICQPGYGGERCQLHKKYNVKCFQDRMCLNVDPPSGYVGRRYIKGKGGNPVCSLSSVTAAAAQTNGFPSTWTGSYICLPHQDLECGNVYEKTETDNSTTRFRQVIIRQNILRTKNDILFTGYCKYNASGELYVDQSNIDPGSGLILVNDTDFVSPATVYIVNRLTGVRITDTGTINIGDEVCFAIALEEGFSAIRLDSVIADDTLASPQTYEILNVGCPVGQNTVSRLPWLPQNGNGSIVYFCINAFLFDRSNRVGFRFQTSICVTSSADCTPYTCGANGVSMGRKKREADVDMKRTLKAIINVNDPREGPIQTTGALTAEPRPECELTTPIIVALAVLAVLTAILLCITVVLFVRATRYRDK